MQIKFIWRLEMVRRVACNDYLYKATFTGAFARYFWHFLAGWVYWGAYALGDETLAFLSGNEYRQRTCYGNRHGNYLTNCLSNIPRGICT